MEEKLLAVNENTDITDENQSTNEDTQSEKQETKITSIKLKRGKVFIVMWAVLATIFVAFIAVTLINYMDYRKAQDAAIEITLAACESIGDDKFEEYKDDRAELCKRMYDMYNPHYFAYKTDYGTINNSGVIDSAEKLEESLSDLMSKMGYDTYRRASNYLKYTNFFDYAYNKLQIDTDNTGLPIYLIICFIALVITVIYLLDRKTKLTVQDDVVLLKKRTGKTVQFKIKDISSIESTAFKGLKLKGNAIKCKIILLKNAEEVRTKITQLISDLSSKNQDLSDQHLNETETIKQYKDLLDSGAITQEEFEAKKKQLLGL